MFATCYLRIWAVLLASALASTTLSAGLAGCSSSTPIPFPTTTPTLTPTPILIPASILPMLDSENGEGTSPVSTWMPTTLEQAIVEQQTRALPEEIAQIGFDQIIPNGLARIGIEGTVVNFSDNGLAGDAYRFAPLTVNSEGLVIWVYDPVVGQHDWPVELEVLSDGNYKLVKEGLSYQTIPDSKDAVIIWGGTVDAVPGKHLAILAKDPITLPDGRQVYAFYWDRTTQEWLSTPGLVEEIAAVFPVTTSLEKTDTGWLAKDLQGNPLARLADTDNWEWLVTRTEVLYEFSMYPDNMPKNIDNKVNWSSKGSVPRTAYMFIGRGFFTAIESNYPPLSFFPIKGRFEEEIAPDGKINHFFRVLAIQGTTTRNDQPFLVQIRVPGEFIVIIDEKNQNTKTVVELSNYSLFWQSISDETGILDSLEFILIMPPRNSSTPPLIFSWYPGWESRWNEIISKYHDQLPIDSNQYIQIIKDLWESSRDSAGVVGQEAIYSHLSSSPRWWEDPQIPLLFNDPRIIIYSNSWLKK